MSPSIAACRDFTKRTLRDIIHGEEVELEAEVEAAGRRAFRSRIALGIVALSILSALAGWRASVFDEASSASAALYHQQVLLQQQRQTIHEGQVDRDLTQFGQFEQHWLLHNALARQAASPGAPGDLSGQAQQESVQAEEALERFGVASISWLPDGDATYDSAAAYQSAVTGDTELEGLRPGDALAESIRKGKEAVRLTLVAALFVAGLVLLTLAQTTLGRRVVPLRPGQRRDSVWSTSHTLVVGGTLFGLVAAVMFIAALVG